GSHKPVVDRAPELASIRALEHTAIGSGVERSRGSRVQSEDVHAVTLQPVVVVVPIATPIAALKERAFGFERPGHDREVRRACKPGYVSVACRISGNAATDIHACSSDISRIDQAGACAIQLGHKGVAA